MAKVVIQNFDLLRKTLEVSKPLDWVWWLPLPRAFILHLPSRPERSQRARPNSPAVFPCHRCSAKFAPSLTI